MYSANHKLIARWAPPNEKGKFISSIMGCALGTVLTWILAGYLIETIGWQYAFYVPAMLMLLFTIASYFLIYDSPAEHPRCLQTEREYIERNLTGVSNDNVIDFVFSLIQ